MFSTIVWATDGSEHADRALEYAVQIAQRDGATIHVAHVVEKLVGVRVAGQNAKLDEGSLDAKIADQVRALGAQHGLTVKLHMTAGRTGDVAGRIAEIAGECRADLIVVGTRGHSAVVGAVIGSVTQRLLHVADCAVLAVPPHRARVTATAASPSLTTVG
jgi:nucleotide-binding universal stress UspA family protein